MRSEAATRLGMLLGAALGLAACHAPLHRETLVFGSGSDASAVPPPPPPPTFAPQSPEAPRTRESVSAGMLPPPPPPPPGLAPGVPTSPIVVPPARIVPLAETPFLTFPETPGSSYPVSAPAPAYPYVPAAPPRTFTPNPCSPCDPGPAPCCPYVPMPRCPGSNFPCPDPFDPMAGSITERPHSGGYVGGGLSFLPNIGINVEAGGVFAWDPGANWSWEIQGTWQFLDDKTFADNGDPEAEDWYALRVGVKVSTNPTSRRHLTYRAGAVWFRAEGVPNWVDDPGDYFGVYGAVGFETDLSCRVTVGPSLTFMGVWNTDTSKFNLVPTLNWNVTFWLGDGWANGPWTGSGWPPGELYVDGVVALSPALGGGAAFGQVFSRDRLAVHSVELEAVYQSLSDSLWSNGDGEFAQVRGGYKASFFPCGRIHPTLRAGGTWFRSTAETDFVDDAGDYVGAYLGAGVEFDLGPRFTTGPELSAALVTQEKESGLEVLPRLSWHLILKL